MDGKARASIRNAIWLCSSCNNLVDRDEQRYTAAILLGWKEVAEADALRNLEKIKASARSTVQELKDAELHREAVRRRDALREAARLSGEVYRLMNFASDATFRSENREYARAIHEQLDAMRPLFTSDPDVAQALLLVGQLAGVAVTIGDMRNELWTMQGEAGRVIGERLRELDAEAVGISVNSA